MNIIYRVYLKPYPKGGNDKYFDFPDAESAYEFITKNRDKRFQPLVYTSWS